MAKTAFKDSINQTYNSIIWTHKIQRTYLEVLEKRRKLFKILKIVFTATASLATATFAFFNNQIGTISSSIITAATVFFGDILDKIIKVLPKVEEEEYDDAITFSIIGRPNVGKSSILSLISDAKPKIANYHFTTLSPHLGVVSLDDGKGFVMADIPGLIEGASEGAGLGHEFLRHIERTKVLIHVVDVSGSEGRNPIEDFDKINNELSAYSERILQKPQLVCANKIDNLELGTDDPRYLEFKTYVEEKGYTVFPCACAFGLGVRELLSATLIKLREVQNNPVEIDTNEYFDFELDDYDPNYRDVEYGYDEEENVFFVEGKQLNKIFNSTNFNDMGSLRYLYKYIENSGAIDGLKEMGLSEGSIIRVNGYDMEYWDEF